MTTNTSDSARLTTGGSVKFTQVAAADAEYPDWSLILDPERIENGMQ